MKGRNYWTLGVVLLGFMVVGCENPKLTQRIAELEQENAKL